MQNNSILYDPVAILADAVPGIPVVEIQKLLIHLSPQQRRLVLHLIEHGESDAETIRERCRVSNVSEAVKSTNTKLAVSGLNKHIACQKRIHVNVHGERGYFGFWSLADGCAADASKAPAASHAAKNNK